LFIERECPGKKNKGQRRRHEINPFLCNRQGKERSLKTHLLEGERERQLGKQQEEGSKCEFTFFDRGERNE